MKKLILSCILFMLIGSLLTALVGCGSSHEHNYVESIVSPTCQEDGYTLYACECGESYKDNPVAKVNHKGNGKCDVCGFDYFDELKSLIIKYGEYTNSGTYMYYPDVYSNYAAAIFYDPSDGQISLMCLDTVYDMSLTIMIPPLSGGTSITEGKYAWLFSFSSMSALGLINGATFSDNTSSLTITAATGVSASQYGNIQSLSATYAKIAIKNALVPLLAKSTNGITPAHFGFVNY